MGVGERIRDGVHGCRRSFETVQAVAVRSLRKGGVEFIMRPPGFWVAREGVHRSETWKGLECRRSA
jgi:hypothetical protein